MNTKNPQAVESGSAVERTVHFSDAVVAIAITLLTLELRLPEGLAPGEVPGHLLDTLYGLFTFLVSFWVIASYWISTTASSTASALTTARCSGSTSCS